MSHRSTAMATLALLATTIFSVSCAKQAGPLKISPQELHLRAHGKTGEFVLNERDYRGLYYKTLDYDKRCATTVSATPKPRRPGDPAHLVIEPKRPGACDVWLFDDHYGREKVSVVVEPN